MATDPRRLFDAKDIEAAGLYAKRVASSDDFYPLLVNTDGSLIVSLTSGTVSIDTAGLATSVGQTTHTTLLTEISAAVRGQLTIGTVTLNTTSVTVNNAVAIPVSLSSTAVTVTGTVSLTTTAVTASLSSTIVTAAISQIATAPVLLSSVISFTATGSTVITAVTSVLHRVYRIAFTVSSSTLVQVRAGSTSLTGWMPLGANGGMVLDFDGEPWFTTGTNEALSLDTTNSTGVAGRIYYTRV